MKTLVSKLVRTMSFWNDIYQVLHNDWKETHIIKTSLWVRKLKVLNRIAKIIYDHLYLRKENIIFHEYYII